MHKLNNVANHEAAHAVANYLFGVHAASLAVAHVGHSCWLGQFRPATAEEHPIKLACVSTLAGMFGYQLGITDRRPRIPNNEYEADQFGACQDYVRSFQICVGLIANRTENLVSEPLVNVDVIL